jgi:DNA invertase Pin-like site-specific DNA recombinase
VRREKRPKNIDISMGLRAAQYVRMSRAHQKYSIHNQVAVIAAYAARHGLAIVRTYRDEGRSGLGLHHRQALKDLISDVLRGHADFARILVYDVSRWGRFQDTDEAAHYEFICKQAGVRVEYCAEEFQNDGSLMSSVAKNLKRAMAGEWSRELSVKVFAGACRLSHLGFFQGGPPSFGLRRQLIDEHGHRKGLLKRGERKNLQTDRVILQPGPPHERELVRDIFRQFVLERKSDAAIARELNRKGAVNHHGRRWTAFSIRSILMNENYIGNMVYNRKTYRLRQAARHNSSDIWIRTTGLFEAIVEPSVFRRAQEIRAQGRMPDQELLARLKSLLKAKGRLSATLINEAEDLPWNCTYITRFGSLRNAYRLIGYNPEGNFNYIDGAHSLAAVLRNVATDIIDRVEAAGGSAHFDETTDVLTLNGKVMIPLYVARCRRTAGGWLRWTVRRRVSLSGDLIIAVRMDLPGGNSLDYLLLPATDFPKERMEFSERNQTRLDACRFETVDDLLQSISRSLVRRIFT